MSEERIIVIGGGTMGAGITQVLVQLGCDLTIIEADASAGQSARARVRAGLTKAHKDRADAAVQIEADLARVSVAEQYVPDAAVSMVIETVPEDVALKTAVLSRAAACWPHAVLASNTSSISINELAKAVTSPGRFIGAHFFNPVPRSALVEIVTAAQTTAETVDSVQDLVLRMGKDGITVRDSPGFATSRLGVAIGLEAIRMVEEGVASVADIDKGMRLGYRFPMGPLELTDLVGLDVRLSVAEYLADEIGPRFNPPELLRSKVRNGELGAKSGQGFYSWKDGKRA